MRVHQRKRQTEHNDERIMEFFMQVTKRQLLLHRGQQNCYELCSHTEVHQE